MSSLTPGTRVGPYEILADLGAGGMGEVYRAHDPRLDRDVALKILPEAMAKNPEGLERFTREARAVAALNHPHIVTIFSTEEADGVRFMTMELIDGHPLDQVIQSSGVSLTQFFDVAVALADALSAAHQKEITHRDLKPANVMVSNDGRVKVLDFGLARAAEVKAATFDEETLQRLTQAGTILGTMPYMSPEQIEAKALDGRSDIFSLGIVMYEMVTGARPFTGTSSPALMSSILKDHPTPVRELRADVPDGVSRLVGRCLEKHPRDRVQTAQEILLELKAMRRAWESGEPGARPREAAGDSAGTRADEGFWVAVLPFKYSGGNTDLKVLAEGLTEDIVAGLSRFSYLRVIAHDSTERYADRAPDVRVVGRELGARYVINGSLRLAGARLRVAVQLVDATRGAQLWTETYERSSSSGAFELQDDLVPRIVSSVADAYGALPQSMSQAVRAKASDQLTPYEALLRSFSYAARITAGEHAGAMVALERAVRQAPDSSDCCAQLSILLSDQHLHGFGSSPDTLAHAIRAARQAVDRGPSNHAAHEALAWALFLNKEFDASRNAAERTLALNPMDSHATALMGQTIAYAGGWERGCELMKRAIELNPNHPGWYWYALFLDAYRSNDFRAALNLALKMNMPGTPLVCVALAASYGQLGQTEAGRSAARELMALRPDYPAAAREELGKLLDSALVEQIIDGLRKAGLDIATGDRPKSATPATEASGPAPSMARSVAVLPFANMSRDAEQDYFSDGLAEEIINLLAHVPGLKVIARTSSFAFRGKDQDIRKIADALGVRTILQGSVRRAGSRIRVTAQLINALDGDHLWAERFDREMTEVFAVQDEIAAAISGALKVTLTGTSPEARSHEPNLPAYDAFLKAQHHYYKFSPEAFDRAEEYLAEAIEQDPHWAEPLAALADLHFSLAFYSWRPFDGLISLARAEAQTALGLLPSHATAHAVLGVIAALHDFDWKEAEEQFRLARASEFRSPNARLYEAFYFLPLGRFDEAIQAVAAAIAQDPLNSFWRSRLTWMFLCADRHEEAIAEARKALEFDSTNYQAFMLMAMSLSLEGKVAEAREAAEEAFRLGPFDSFCRGLLAGLLKNAGEKERATRMIEEMTGAVPIGMAMYHLTCSEIDAALDWYEKDIELRRPNGPMIAAAGFSKPLRSSPRWPTLARMMNLKAHAADTPS